MAIPLQHDVEYPYSDGKPIAESEVHLWELMDLIGALDDHFSADPDAYVAGNLFVYFEKGVPSSVVAPDVFVVKGVPMLRGDQGRKVFKLWEEGVTPCFVIEITSDSTRDEDLEKKKDCYERLGVEEYILHDPLGEYLDPPLQGYRLASGPGSSYRSLKPAQDGSLMSLTTGLTLKPKGRKLELIVTATGERLLGTREAQELARAARARLERQRSSSSSAAGAEEASADSSSIERSTPPRAT